MLTTEEIQESPGMNVGTGKFSDDVEMTVGYRCTDDVPIQGTSSRWRKRQPEKLGGVYRRIIYFNWHRQLNIILTVITQHEKQSSVGEMKQIISWTNGGE